MGCVQQVSKTDLAADCEGAPHGLPPSGTAEGRQASTDEEGFFLREPCAEQFRQPAPLSGPKYFGADFLYALSEEGDDHPGSEGCGQKNECVLDLPDIQYDVDPDDVIPFREEDFSSPALGEQSASPNRGCEVRVCSWNLAGTSEKKVKHLLSHVPCCDVLAVQEFPRQKCTWQVLKGSTFHAVLFQRVMMYRAVGIFYKPELFHLKRKVSTSKGMWLRLQHKRSQKHLWVGSAHLPNNEPREEINRWADEFFRACACGLEQAFAMGTSTSNLNGPKLQEKWCQGRSRPSGETFGRL